MVSKSNKKGCQYKFKQGNKKGKICGKGCRGKFCKDHKPNRNKYFKSRYQNKKEQKIKDKLELLKNGEGKIYSLDIERQKNMSLIYKIGYLMKIEHGINLFLNPDYILPINKKYLSTINNKETYVKQYEDKCKEREKELKNKYRRLCIKNNNFGLTEDEYFQQNKYKINLVLKEYDPEEYRILKNKIINDYENECIKHTILNYTLEEYIKKNQKIESFEDFFEREKEIKLRDSNIRMPYKKFEGTKIQAQKNLNKINMNIKRLKQKYIDHSLFLSELQKLYKDNETKS